MTLSFASIDPLSQYDPELLEFLSPAERAQLEDDLERLVGGESACDFITRVWPYEPPPRHTLPIVDAVQQARVTPLRMFIDVGPGHAKTTILLRLLIWWLCRSPADQCGYITYSDDQAANKSRVALGYARDAELALAKGSKAVSLWHTTREGGVIAAGIQGQLTGQRIPGIILVDDPYKSAVDARSPAVNEAIKERFKSVVMTRLQGGSVIVLHTRWAEDDLGGWLVNTLKWDNIHIPTVCDDAATDVLGRRTITHAEYVQLPAAERACFGIFDDKRRLYGEVAWPERIPYEICTEPCGHDQHLAELRSTLGEHLWSAMFQGSPRPLGKSVFHEPARYARVEFTWNGKRGCIALDTAASSKTSADWTVMLVCAMEGYGPSAVMWIVDCVRVQEEVPDIVATARRLQLKYKLPVGVETVAAGSGRSVSQMLRKVDPALRIIDIEVGGRDKFTRAIPVSAAWNAGRVRIPIDAPWADTFINEHKKFTGLDDAHDDQVDADAHAWNLLYRARPKITSDDYVQDSGM